MEAIFYSCFYGITNKKHEITIYDRISVNPSNPQNIILENPGYELSYDSGISDIVQYGICSSSVSLTIRNLSNFLDSFLASLQITENRYLIEIKINDEAFWRGVLLSEFSNVEDAAYSGVTLEAVDGLKLLTKKVEIIDINVKHSFLDYIIKALSLIPTSELFNETDSFVKVRSDWYNYLMDSTLKGDALGLISCADTANSFLWQTKTRRTGWNGEIVYKIEAVTYFEMLQKILNPFMLVLAMNNGKWYIAQRDLFENNSSINYFQYTKTLECIKDISGNPILATETTYLEVSKIKKVYRSKGEFTYLPGLKQAETTFLSAFNGNSSMISENELNAMLNGGLTYVSPKLYKDPGNLLSLHLDFTDYYEPSNANYIWNAIVEFHVEIKLIGDSGTVYYIRRGSPGPNPTAWGPLFHWNTGIGDAPFMPGLPMGTIVHHWDFTGPVTYQHLRQEYSISLDTPILPEDGVVEIKFFRDSPQIVSYLPLNPPPGFPIPTQWGYTGAAMGSAGANYLKYIVDNQTPANEVFFKAENDNSDFTLVNTLDDTIFDTIGTSQHSTMEIWDGFVWSIPIFSIFKYWRKGNTGSFDQFFGQLLVNETLSNQENSLLVFNGDIYIKNSNDTLNLFKVIELNYKQNYYRLWANKVTYTANDEKWNGDWFTIRRQRRPWHITVAPNAVPVVPDLTEIVTEIGYTSHRLDMLQVSNKDITIEDYTMHINRLSLSPQPKPAIIPDIGVLQQVVGNRIIQTDSKGVRIPMDGKNLVIYGYLYNWYALTNLANTMDGWRVPTVAAFDKLKTYVETLYPTDTGIYMRTIRQSQTTVPGGNTEIHPYFASEVNQGLDVFNLFLVPGGLRDAKPGLDFENITFGGLYLMADEYSETEANTLYIQVGDSQFNLTNTPKYYGASVRLVRDASLAEVELVDGTYVEPYVGNDGKTYVSVKIGNQVWTAENLAETKYDKGDLIDSANKTNLQWAALTTGARCSYNNDPSLAIYLSGMKDVTKDTDIFQGKGTEDDKLSLVNKNDNKIYGIKNGKFSLISVGSDTSPSAELVGVTRYRTEGSNFFFEVCMQTAADVYSWIVLAQTAFK